MSFKYYVLQKLTSAAIITGLFALLIYAIGFAIYTLPFCLETNRTVVFLGNGTWVENISKVCVPGDGSKVFSEPMVLFIVGILALVFFGFAIHDILDRLG